MASKSAASVVDFSLHAGFKAKVDKFLGPNSPRHLPATSLI